MTITARLTPDAFAEAFVASSRSLWCIAAGVLGDRTGADDVLQEGAMIALSKLEQFDPETNFLAWMGRIVRYVALNHARRRRRAPAAVVDPQTLESTTAQRHPEPSVPAATVTDIPVDQQDFDDDVVHALKSLDEAPRTCLLLRTLMQLPYRDIALAMDIPEGTAMSHVHRARQHLRRRLDHLAPASTEPETP